jgi:nicotinamidase-related amidase
MSWIAPPRQVTVTFTAPTPKPVTLDASRTLVCVVDMQQLTCTPGFTPSSGGDFYRERYAQAVEGCKTLLDKARGAGATVIFVQSVRKPTGLEFTVFGVPRMLQEGTPDVEIVEQLRPLPGERVVQKWSHDPFARTKLDETLVELGVEPGEWTVVLPGVSASACHHCGALGFANRHFMTVIPMDAAAAETAEYELQTYAEYLEPGYSYCVAFTTSDLITFAPGAPVSGSARELTGVGAERVDPVV